MSNSVMIAICDADLCERLGAVGYSTNPRKIVTVEDMLNFNRLQQRIKEVGGE